MSNRSRCETGIVVLCTPPNRKRTGFRSQSHQLSVFLFGREVFHSSVSEQLESSSFHRSTSGLSNTNDILEALERNYIANRCPIILTAPRRYTKTFDCQATAFLLTLHAEFRNAIYLYCRPEGLQLLRHVSSTSHSIGGDVHKRPFLALAHINRQLRSEFIPLYCGITTCSDRKNKLRSAIGGEGGIT